MFLSKIKIRNFRSIENIDLEFKKGKNIILGKNNSGKSNIVKAINLILGENSPNWEKSNNILESDFFKGDKNKDIIIYCELEREDGELIDYSEINKCFSFKVPDKNKYSKDPVLFPFDPDNNEDFEKSVSKFVKLREEFEIKTSKPAYWVGTKDYCKKFHEEFEDKFFFSFIFKAYYVNDKIKKELIFLYKKKDSDNWVFGLNAPIRNEFIQSAMIPSFRDPNSQLRINNFSWFGKLLKEKINFESSDLKEKFSEVKKESDKIFNEVNEEVNSDGLAIAFPNTKINFQLNPENGTDIHKNTLIYVDDGYNSLIHEKGSGIQSSIIIGLFNYYIKKKHVSNSLLIIEEPELFLHPQGKRVISNKLENFLEDNKNQVIITTHASEFITTTGEDVNIILVKKSNENSSIAKNTTFENSKFRQLLSWKENSEMFFADRVILVEGGDRFIIELIAKYYGEIKGDQFWLDNNNFSVISVGGKDKFWKYYLKLNELGIKTYLIADFDFLIRRLSEFFSKIGKFENLKIQLDEYKSRIGDKVNLKKVKKKNEIPKKYLFNLENIISDLRDKDINILSGELEDFFTAEMNEKISKSSCGKEEKVIKLTYDYIEKNEDILKYIKEEEFINIIEKIYSDI